jgi:hypothetical protein
MESIKTIIGFFWLALIAAALMAWLFIATLATAVNLLVGLEIIARPLPPERYAYFGNPLVTAAIAVIAFALLKMLHGVWKSNRLQKSYHAEMQDIATRFNLSWKKTSGGPALTRSFSQMQELYKALPEQDRINADAAIAKLNQDCYEKGRDIKQAAMSWLGYAFLSGIFLIIYMLLR